jgi:hypothetical protein
MKRFALALALVLGVAGSAGAAYAACQTPECCPECPPDCC